jgi:hypothetical protein
VGADNHNSAAKIAAVRGAAAGRRAGTNGEAAKKFRFVKDFHAALRERSKNLRIVNKRAKCVNGKLFRRRVIFRLGTRRRDSRVCGIYGTAHSHTEA